MKNYKVLFTSDLHGNIIQYNKLFNKAKNDFSDLIIIGGDLTPKDTKNRTVEKQKEFIIKKLVPLLKNFNKVNEKKCKIYLIMGNDDFKENEKVLLKYQKEGNFKLINNKCINLNEDFQICGYPYVPLTPFKFKDWERLDLSNQLESSYRQYIDEGIIAKSNFKLIKKKFNINKREINIEKDLIILLSNIKKKLIFISHAPPYNTNLDKIKGNISVGSKAIKKILKEKNIYLSLHGHIHETVDISKKYQDIIGKTISMTAGNDYRKNNLKILSFNAYNPIAAKRLII